MKCPFRIITTHIPERRDGYVISYARDEELFADCYRNDCPFYESIDKCGRTKEIIKKKGEKMKHFSDYAKKRNIRRTNSIRLNEDAIMMLDYIMEKENIPHISKAIRYCVYETYNELKESNN